MTVWDVCVPFMHPETAGAPVPSRPHADPPGSSVLNAERVPERSVKSGALVRGKAPYRALIEQRLGDGHDVVAVDDAPGRKALCTSHLDFGPDASHRSGDRGAGDSGEDLDSGIPGQDANRSASGWRT